MSRQTKRFYGFDSLRIDLIDRLLICERGLTSRASVGKTQTIPWTLYGRGLIYNENHAFGAAKQLVQPLDGSEPKLMAEFETERVLSFDWSREGKYLTCVRGLWATNVVLIKDFR